MRAIVLSYDANSDLTELMVRQFRRTWPDHPFTFRIPFQSPPATPLPECEYVETPPPITETVLTLLDGLAGEEWVLWSTDDLYPVWLDTERLKAVHDQLVADAFPDLGMVAFLTSNLGARSAYKKRLAAGAGRYTIGGLRTIEIPDYEEVFLNPFIRVRHLRQFFEDLPAPKHGAKEMDFTKSEVEKPQDAVFVMLERDLGVFGEAASRGLITRNCLRDMKRIGMRPNPDRDVSRPRGHIVRGWVNPWRRYVSSRLRRS